MPGPERETSTRRGSPGSVTLHVGEGCDFRTSEIFTHGSLQRADLVCVDITGQHASVECPSGCVEPRLPPIVIGPRPTRAECFDDLYDAPEELPLKFAVLREEGQSSISGLAIVKARGGQAFKVMAVEVKAGPRVLERTVAIRFEPVPTKAGGGQIRLEGQLEFVKFTEGEEESLRKMRDRPKVPGDSFKSFIDGGFMAVASLPEKFETPAQMNVGVIAPLQSEVTLSKQGSSLYLPHGLGKRGKVKLTSYAGVLIDGDLDGEIEVQSYGYLHVMGSLNGTISCGSYATVVIDGDVRGVLRVRSYVKLLLGGRFLDPENGLDAGAGYWCTFYFRSYTPRSEMERFTVSNSYTLHVRDSDLPGGRHERIGKWKEVFVADPLWQSL